jgi:hypothetical protein
VRGSHAAYGGDVGTESWVVRDAEAPAFDRTPLLRPGSRGAVDVEITALDDPGLRGRAVADGRSTVVVRG